jgi:tetratricopeptide (TPR) repeat protein/TolB-like protein
MHTNAGFQAVCCAESLAQFADQLTQFGCAAGNISLACGSRAEYDPKLDCPAGRTVRTGTHDALCPTAVENAMANTHPNSLEVAASVLLLSAMALPLQGQPSTQATDHELRQRRVIAVMDLKNLRPDDKTDWLGGCAAETLATKLTSIPELVIVQRTQISRILDEQDFQKLDLVDSKSTAKVGKILGAQRIVIGSYAVDGDSVLFNIHVVDVQSAEILSAVSLTGTRDKIFDAISELANAVIVSFAKKIIVVNSKPLVTEAPSSERIELADWQKESLRESGATTWEAYWSGAMGAGAPDFDEAIRLLDKAILLDPKFAQAYKWRAMWYSFKDNDHAIADYGKAIELNPRDSQAYSDRGLLRAALGNIKLAVEDYTKAIEINPTDRSTYAKRASVLAMIGEFDRAIADANKVIEMAPKESNGYYWRAMIWGDRENYERAIQDCDTVVKMTPKSDGGYLLRGIYQCARGRHDLAIKDFSNSIKGDPKNPLTYQCRAQCYYHTKDYGKAWKDVSLCRELGGKVETKFVEELKSASGRQE